MPATLDRVRAMFPVGTEFEVVEQTYQPHLVGQRRVVKKAQRETLKVCIVGEDEKSFQAVLPHRAGDVLALREDYVRFALAGREGHTVAFRVVGQPPVLRDEAGNE